MGRANSGRQPGGLQALSQMPRRHCVAQHGQPGIFQVQACILIQQRFHMLASSVNLAGSGQKAGKQELVALDVRRLLDEPLDHPCRLRMIARATKGRCDNFLSVGGVPAYRGWTDPWQFDPPGLPVPVREDMSLDIDGIAGALSRDTGAVLVNSPGNPSGHVLQESELRELTTLLDAHNARKRSSGSSPRRRSSGVHASKTLASISS